VFLTTKAQLGVAFHDQAAVEEQGVGVLLALREQHKVVRRGADAQVGFGVARARGKGDRRSR
jgi:hypothetical protein